MNGDKNLIRNDFWQTKYRGSNDQEYQIYLDLADDGKGFDYTTKIPHTEDPIGKPLKTYDEWLNT